MKLLYYPDKKLFIKSKEIAEGVAMDLVVQMFDIMEKHNGVGLSAIQVGVPLCLFVMKHDGQKSMFLNPKITNLEGDLIKAPEGCLSAPGFYQDVVRYSMATLEHGVPGARITSIFEGIDARIVQHETEHCEGKMFTDNFTNAQKGALMGHMMKLRKAGKLK